MELYLTVIFSVVSIAGISAVFAGYNIYKTIKENNKKIEILKTLIIEEVKADTRDRVGFQV